MEFSKKSLNKQPFDKLLYNVHKKLSLNPFNSKVNTKVSKTTNLFIDKITTPDKNKHKKIQETQKNIDEIKYSLQKYDIPVEDIEEILTDLNRDFDSKGVMAFYEGLGNKTFMNQQVLVLSQSKGGKSYTTTSLFLELPQSYSLVTIFTGKASYENSAAQALRQMCEDAGVNFAWFNTDIDKPIEYSEENISFEDYKKKYEMEDGSVSKIYNNTFPSCWLFDDLYTKPTDSHIFKYIEDCSIKGRHKKISYFLLYQSYTRLSSKILDNLTKMFIHKDFLGREDLWKKLRIPEPSNLQEVLAEPYEQQSRFYYLNDDTLLPFNNYSYSSKSQIIKKLKSHLPVGFVDKKKKEIYEAKMKEIQKLEKREKEKKQCEQEQSKFEEQQKVGGIDTIPKEQKTLVGKVASHDNLKMNPMTTTMRYESNAIKPRQTSFNYNFIPRI